MCTRVLNIENMVGYRECCLVGKLEYNENILNLKIKIQFKRRLLICSFINYRTNKQGHRKVEEEKSWKNKWNKIHKKSRKGN